MASSEGRWNRRRFWVEVSTIRDAPPGRQPVKTYLADDAQRDKWWDFVRRKLRPKRPDRALVELDWSLVGLTIIQLFAVMEQNQFGEPPEQCSVSLAIRIVRETVDRWHETPAAGETFRLRLRAAIIDDYQRTTSKKARYRTDSKDKPSARKPKLLKATKQHKLWLAKLLTTAA